MCASVEWVIVNTTYKRYFVNGKCQDGNPFDVIQSVACACPLPVSIKPCTCEVAPSYGTDALKIDCSTKSLNDSQAKTIINNIPPTTPVAAMDLSRNQLTVVPQGLSKLITMLIELNLGYNEIVVIQTGDLAFNSSKSTLRYLDLSHNANLTTIEEASLPGLFQSITTFMSTFHHYYTLAYLYDHYYYYYLQLVSALQFNRQILSN